jgi:hypothetical protein
MPLSVFAAPMTHQENRQSANRAGWALAIIIFIGIRSFIVFCWNTDSY